MDPDHFVLERNDWVPNNPALPVLHYRRAQRGGSAECMASDFEQTFTRHGWPADWRDGIYDYHHYHSSAHEVLGIAAGSSTVMLGGPDGRRIDLEAGDVLVLPAGTGHCRLDASADFLVVGAYPVGQRWDICRSAPSDVVRARIASLPIPHCDPWQGGAGWLVRLWLQG